MATLVRNPTTTKPNATSFKGGSPSSRRGGRVQHRRYRHGSQRVLHVCRVGHFGSAGSQVVHPNSTFAASIFSLCLPKCFACTVPLRFKLATNPQASPLCHAAGHNDVLGGKITIHLRCPDSPWYFYFVLATWRGSLLWWEGKKRNLKKKSGKAVASLNSLELWVRFSSPKVLPTWTHPRVRFLGVWADFLSWKQRIKRDKVLYYNCSKVCIQHPVKRLLEDLCQLCPSARAPMGCSSPIDLKPFVAFIPHCRANLKLVAQKLCFPFPFDEPSVAMSFQPPPRFCQKSPEWNIL